MTERKSVVHPLDTEIKERRKRLLIEQMPIARELARVGIYMQLADEARLEDEQFRKAAPIFLKHLHDSGYTPLTRAILADRFARRDANPYWQSLASLYRREASKPKELVGELPMALAGALGMSTTTNEILDLIDLLRDHNLSMRVLLLTPLQRRRRRPEIAAVIDELRNDPALVKEISSWKVLK